LTTSGYFEIIIKMNLSLKRIFLAAIAVFLILGAFGAGFLTAVNISSDEYASNKIPDIFTNSINGTNVPNNVDLGAFWETWNKINELYIGEMPTDEEKIWGATQGLVSSLDDPYSVFFPPRESEYFESEIRGDFEGVGMEIEVRDNILTVVAPLKGTPAERAGVQPGDKIIKIDDTSTIDLSIDQAVDLIRGPKGTSVVLSVIRESAAKPIDISVIRDTINLPVLETEKIEDKKTLVIRLYNFSAPSADKFREALREFVNLNINEGYDKLIIDLRNNPGGYLEAAVDMASWFLPAGKVVVEEDFGGKWQGQIYRSKGYNIFNENLLLAILINKGSASASEILAGALSKHGKAILVGEQTFGKGSVQQLVDITTKTSLKITVAQWLLPDGSTISKEGVAPDYEILFTEEDVEVGNDPQLEKAIELLNEQK